MLRQRFWNFQLLLLDKGTFSFVKNAVGAELLEDSNKFKCSKEMKMNTIFGEPLQIKTCLKKPKQNMP